MSHFALSILSESKIAWDTILCNPRIEAWTFPVAQDNGLQTVILISHLVQSVAKLHHQALPNDLKQWCKCEIALEEHYKWLGLHWPSMVGGAELATFHRAYTKQHILLLLKEPMKIMPNPEKLWSHVFEKAKGHQSSMSPMSDFATLCHHLYTWYSEIDSNVKG